MPWAMIAAAAFGAMHVKPELGVRVVGKDDPRLFVFPRKIQPINCVNCGAPAQRHEETCSYCTSILAT